MTKSKKNFCFIYPVTKLVIDISRPGGKRYDHVTDLIVTGVGYNLGGTLFEDLSDRYEFDIESITHQDRDIRDILDAFDSLDKINDACFHFIHHKFTGQESEYKVPQLHPFPSGKVISLPLKRNIK
ncbi:MAG: hypothetical protein ABIO04_11770 [Ferruginibacter sp.]